MPFLNKNNKKNKFKAGKEGKGRDRIKEEIKRDKIMEEGGGNGIAICNQYGIFIVK